MFDFHVNEGQNALVGCGLGGTSLINADVALEPEPEVFADARWPRAVREHRDTLLAEGFARAREMLKPTPYPEDAPTLPKLEAHKRSAEAMGQDFYRPPINVTFANPPGGVNHVGVEQKACIYCGDCVSGCNHHAKNTTLMNYLPDAWNHGTEIFCEASARYVEKAHGGWHVHCQPIGVGREKFDAPTLFVKAKTVVLCAGTLGSSEILLRSRANGLATSAMLGERFSGNGDILGFGYNCDVEVNGIGFGHRPTGEIPPVGPCITSIIDMRRGDDWTKHMVIEEGSVPGAIAPTLPAALAAARKAFGKDTDSGFIDAAQEQLRELTSTVRGAYHGAVNNTQTYLIMSHDDGRGRLMLEDDDLRIVWPDVGTQPNFEIGNDNLFDATKALGGIYVKNPIWSKIFDNSLITVHPLGGCVMGEDAGQGVVDHKNRVFAGTSGDAVHDGLYVCDGAVLPTSLAVNPLLTISAVTERCCAIMAEDRGWTIDYTLPSARSDGAGEASTAKLGIRFTETMRGWFSTEVREGDEIADYAKAATASEAAGSPFEFTFTIASDDLDQMLESPEHQAKLVGDVSAPALSAKPMTATDGVFNLFMVYPERPDTRHMVYGAKLSSEEGKTYWFHGYKVVHDNPNALDIWPDTSTLYITVHEGGDASDAVLGKGVLHIEPADFAKQMTTMQVTNARNLVERLEATARFGRYFAGVLWQTYGGVFSKPNVFDPDAPLRKRRPLRAPTPILHPFGTEDGVALRLTRYRAGDKGPVILVHGLGVASSIFSTDTIDTNMVEFLCGHGYDVWLLDLRVSIDLPAAAQPSNADQVAKFDYPAAIEVVRSITRAKNVQFVVHCYGGTTFFMSMLGGLEHVRSIVCSQIASDVVTPTATKIKTGLHLPSFLDELGIDSLTAYVDTHADWKERVYDKSLSLYALGAAQGWCTNPVCHRITFMYAPLYRHDTLNQTLHDNLHELFGVANIKAFEALAVICRAGKVVDFDGNDVYMPHFDRLNLPIAFVHGADNECYLPKSTEITYDRLRERFGDDEKFARHVIPGYGHIDCMFGANAAADVFPHVLAHLEKTATA